jgi:SNF2 family DNA or RNA helicase
LTGTPLVNSLNDAFPYLRFIGMPKYGERDGKNRTRVFIRRLARTLLISKGVFCRIRIIRAHHEDREAEPGSGLEKIGSSLNLRGVMIRRTKKCEFDGKSIITLPIKHKEDIDIIISPEERDVYDA